MLVIEELNWVKISFLTSKLNIELMKYLRSFEMWRRRRMEEINWPEKLTNELVLERIGE